MKNFQEVLSVPENILNASKDIQTESIVDWETWYDLVAKKTILETKLSISLRK